MMAAVQIPAPHSPPPADSGARDDPSNAMPAGLGRRFASLIYEALLLTALVLVATFPFVGLTGGRITPAITFALQVYIIAVVGAYFTWFWRHGGQTLPMKTWGIRVIRVDAKPLTFKDAAVRYAAAWLSLAFAGLGFWWALWDRDRQFLHDRIAKTRQVDARPGIKLGSGATAKP